MSVTVVPSRVSSVFTQPVEKLMIAKKLNKYKSFLSFIITVLNFSFLNNKKNTFYFMYENQCSILNINSFNKSPSSALGLSIPLHRASVSLIYDIIFMVFHAP